MNNKRHQPLAKAFVAIEIPGQTQIGSRNHSNAVSDCQIRRSWKETSCLAKSPMCLKVDPTVRKLSDTRGFIFIKRFSRVVCQGNFLNLLPQNPFPSLVFSKGEDVFITCPLFNGG
ncbi:hypothetical protein CDAR_373041 [Caerostris darwini]|uniref:Uncharacterized protein n=1 Tax=Caerostris darwini TaxID=1538125 RepID=A0AAV4STF4_9ARAC|nr:hypothetical protein CDAR_373041 [Caerostris darwini]